MKDIRKKTVKGVVWTVASQFSRMFITLVVTAVLAHLLSPSDFGLIAMVMVFSTFFTMFNDIGLPSALIQKQDLSEEDISSAFWLNLAEGVIVTIIFFALAPVIAGFYSESLLRPIVMVMSAMFTITSLGMIQLALFSRQMDFRFIAIAEITSYSIGGTAAIVMAATGFGVWSIVAQYLVQSTLLAAILFFGSKWKPKLIFRWQPAKGLLGFGLPLMGFSFLNYFNRNLDNLLIGKYLGAKQLGYYDIAYKSLLFPLASVSRVIGRVMFPALSRLEDDKARVRAAYIRSTRYIAFITFPLMAGLAVLAPQFVRVVLGSQWERSIFLIQIFALIGGLQSLYTTIGWLYLSQGRTGIMFLFGLLTAVVYVTSFVVGLRWEVEGVAVAYAIAFVLLLYPSFAIPFRFIDMKFWHYVRQFLRIILSTFGTAAVMVGLLLLFTQVFSFGDIATLIIIAAAGLMCYMGLIWLLDRGLITGLRGILQDVKSKSVTMEDLT